MVILGVALALCAALFYATSTVLQVVAARQVAPAGVKDVGLRALSRRPSWLVGIALQCLAFLCFVLSTRVLALPVAEALRGSYLIVAVLLAHVVFRTRPSATELVGVLLVLLGLVLFVGEGGHRRSDDHSGLLVPVMVLTLSCVVLCASLVATRLSERPGTLGAVEAALGGTAFAMVDLGVRSVPQPFAVGAIASQPACWVAAPAALIGLILFARATSRTSVGVAESALIILDVVVASALSIRLFGDSLSSPWPLALAAAALMIVGAVMVLRAADRVGVGPHMSRLGDDGGSAVRLIPD
jgi:drug/metabolite transporter (DMT)-like permease